MSIRIIRADESFDRTPEWEDVFEFVEACSKAHTVRDFASRVIQYAQDIVRFDQALVYFIDGNGRIRDQYLLEIASEYSNLYQVLFADLVEEPYHMSNSQAGTLFSEPILTLIDWKKEPSREMINLVIRPRGLTYTMSMVFFDNYGRPRTIICLDKVKDRPFKEQEVVNIAKALPVLGSIHENYFYKQSSSIERELPLTKREMEIANLLCQGITPSNISSILHISTATTYKHVSNIYNKLDVRNQLELLAFMLRDE